MKKHKIDFIEPGSIAEELGIEKGTGAEYRSACRMVMGRIQAMRERDLKELKA